MTVLEILTNVKEAKAIDYVELLNKNNTDKDHIADKSRIEELLRNNYLKGSTEPYSTITLTNKGQCLLDELQKTEKDTAQEKSNKKKERKFEIVLAIIGIIVSLLSLFLPYVISLFV